MPQKNGYEVCQQIKADDRLLQLLEQIPAEEQSMANQLSKLVRRLCFDEILELLPEE